VEQIIALAERLGKAIAASPQAAAMRAARDELDKDKDVSAVLEEFQKQSQKIARLEEENKPVEVEDKHKLRDLREKLAASETFKKYSAAQVEYVDLMRKVDEALQQEVSEADAEQTDSADGEGG
jgi:cell fate (sporulation/competence/biofilm development) regulator YlbF (YheA/YmcA/DUF963 family)